MPGFLSPRETLEYLGISKEQPRQEYWGGVSPSPGDRPNPGIEPSYPTLQVDSLPAEPPGKLSGSI